MVSLHLYWGFPVGEPKVVLMKANRRRPHLPVGTTRQTSPNRLECSYFWTVRREKSVITHTSHHSHWRPAPGGMCWRWLCLYCRRGQMFCCKEHTFTHKSVFMTPSTCHTFRQSHAPTTLDQSGPSEEAPTGQAARLLLLPVQDSKELTWREEFHQSKWRRSRMKISRVQQCHGQV